MTRQLEIRLHSDDLVVDGFAGGGGTSLGIEWALGRSPDIAINHDIQAVHMHAENHPATRHYCASIHDVDPATVTSGRRVALAWFSPDCKHHSKAKGGKPRDKGIRDLAWVVVRWATAVRPRVIMLENVEEFAGWGPLLANGRPCPRRKGDTFRRWWAALEAEGYRVETRVLRACDYGAPTIRRRLFVIARCDGAPIVWPAPTHGAGLVPYRVAAECIQWELAAPSIFERRRQLADNTLRRIARGIWKYVIDEAEPFLVPVKTWGGGGNGPRSMLEQMRTVTSSSRGEYAMVVAFLAKHYGGHQTPGAALPAPISTITARDHHGLVTSHIRHHNDGRPMVEPMDTISAGGLHFGEVRAFLTKYYGTRSPGQSLTEPAHTVTSRDRFGLVTVAGGDLAIADIGMRMLAPRELYRAQGFPDSYRIDFAIGARPLSKTAQIKMCGNSVCPPIAAALVRANMVGVRNGARRSGRAARKNQISIRPTAP